MSCDWYLHCVDCDEDAGFSDLNHQVASMRALATHGPRLVANLDEGALAALEALSAAGVAVVFGPRDWDQWKPLGWLIAHKGHKLVARDEYGQDDGQCAERFVCSGGHQHPCELEDKHAGEHGPRPKEPTP